MATNFKKQVSQQRAAVPQVDPEGANAAVPVPAYPGEPANSLPSMAERPPVEQAGQPAPLVQAQPAATDVYRITMVDSSEAPVNRGFFMYPSRHRQVARDLAYIEDRKPWQIIETALEEYVIKHYGKAYKRK